MDNLAHSLVGAALGQAGLKRASGLGMATLIVAANLPDIDVLATVLGTEALAWRRGLTHGPLGLLVLPPVLALAMFGFDRWQARRGTRPEARAPVRFWALLLLAYIGALSHPALDFLNNYGIRLLSPFSERWFYGDTLFIIDVWMWSALALGIWLGRRREKAGGGATRIPAIAALGAVALYIGANGIVSTGAERVTARAAEDMHGLAPDLVVANTVPVAFWRREMIYRIGNLIGRGDYDLARTDAPLALSGTWTSANMRDPAVDAAARMDRDMEAFLFWARIPYARLEDIEGGTRVTMRDARFDGGPTAGSFTVVTEVPEPYYAGVSWHDTEDWRK